MRKIALVIAGSLVFASAPAMAEEPYYFHKPGISRDAYMADVSDCAELAGGARFTHYDIQPTNPNARYAAVSAGIASFFSGFLERRERRRVLSRIERTCMADKGYQRRSIDKPTYKAIGKLEGEARIDRLFALVAAGQPIGKVLIE